MSIQKITDIFQNLNNCSLWSLQLLNITTNKDGVGYSSREIELSPVERLTNLLEDIAETYLKGKKKALSLYQDIREYDGTVNALTIYKMSTDNELIATEYNSMLSAVADPDAEGDPFKYTSAYLIKGVVDLDGEEFPVKMFSMQNPVTTLKNKFAHDNGRFYEISHQVLSLRPTIDVVVIGKNIYFLTMAGENLFNMARSYKKVCQAKVDLVVKNEIVTDTEAFTSIAVSGHNPRRFVSFNEERLTALKKKAKRTSIAAKFSIPLDPVSGKFDTTVEGASEKIVKLLCNKGMLDPFDNDAVEVDGARQWK